MRTENRCACGKVMFDKKTAQTKRNQLEHQGRERMRIYQCPESDMWHLTKYNPYGYEKPKRDPFSRPYFRR